MTIAVIAASVIAFGIDSILEKPMCVELMLLAKKLVRDDRQWWRLLSYAFVHGGALHLGMNMFVAYQMGPPMERRLGSIRFAEISLITALGGAAGALLLSPERAVVGASGMILGWAGMIVPLLDRKNLAQFGRFLLINALISFLPGVSWQGHLGGFVAGLACGAVLRLRHQAFSTVAPVLVAATALAALAGAYRQVSGQ